MKNLTEAQLAALNKWSEAEAKVQKDPRMITAREKIQALENQMWQIAEELDQAHEAASETSKQLKTEYKTREAKAEYEATMSGEKVMKVNYKASDDEWEKANDAK